MRKENAKYLIDLVPFDFRSQWYRRNVFEALFAIWQ
jgi:hypothetical protein